MCTPRLELDPMGFPPPIQYGFGVVGEVLCCGLEGTCGAPGEVHNINVDIINIDNRERSRRRSANLSIEFVDLTDHEAEGLPSHSAERTTSIQ